SFASLPDLRRLIRAVGVSVVAVLVLAMFGKAWLLIPRSIVLLYPLLLVMVMGGGRIAWRLWKESRLAPVSDAERKPVVVVGAGTAGAMLVRELARSPAWKVVALVDDDRHKRGLDLNGCRVEGSTRDLPTILKRHGARHVILAMPSASAEALQAVTRLATGAGAALFTVPGLAELMSGRVAINMMRPVKI